MQATTIGSVPARTRPAAPRIVLVIASAARAQIAIAVPSPVAAAAATSGANEARNAAGYSAA